MPADSSSSGGVPAAVKRHNCWLCVLRRQAHTGGRLRGKKASVAHCLKQGQGLLTWSCPLAPSPGS